MSFIKEFKEFAMRGNVIDLAVGIIIGSAFQKIVSSFVADVIMPPIGLLIGGVTFTDLTIKMPSPLPNVEAVTINYGNFLQVTFDFIIVAFCIFLFVKGINTLKKRAEKNETAKTAAPEPSKEEVLLTEIRDILKNK